MSGKFCFRHGSGYSDRRRQAKMIRIGILILLILGVSGQSTSRDRVDQSVEGCEIIGELQQLHSDVTKLPEVIVSRVLRESSRLWRVRPPATSENQPNVNGEKMSHF